jgi:hypothetical protein
MWNWIKDHLLYPIIILYETLIGKWPYTRPKGRR